MGQGNEVKTKARAVGLGLSLPYAHCPAAAIGSSKVSARAMISQSSKLKEVVNPFSFPASHFPLSIAIGRSKHEVNL